MELPFINGGLITKYKKKRKRAHRIWKRDLTNIHILVFVFVGLFSVVTLLIGLFLWVALLNQRRNFMGLFFIGISSQSEMNVKI